MKRLIIDASHILKQSLYAAVKEQGATLVEFNGEQVTIPAAEDGLEIFYSNLKLTLDQLKMVPSQIIMVKDGKNANLLRREFHPEYKKKPPGAPEFYDQFVKLQDMAEATILSYGGISMCKDGYEADDLVASLASVLDHIIWSGDKDLLAHGNVFYKGVINPDEFFGIAKKHICCYKSLVGDSSDNVPGIPGTGPKAFLSLLEKYGDEGLDDMKDMLENETLHELEPYVADFKPFRKIIDGAESAYMSYKCVKPYHPGWHDIQWKAAYPKGDGTFPEWDLKIELVDKNKLADIMPKLKSQIKQAPGGVAFDIETWSDEESLEWSRLNTKRGKNPKLDVYGQHLAGFSITAGPNSNNVYYFPVEHKDTANISLEDVQTIINMVDESKPMYVFNASFELPIMRKHVELRFDRGWLPNVLDTLIMKSYVNENTPLGLKYCSKTYLGYNQVSFEEVTEGEAYVSDEDEDEEVEDVTDVVPSRQMNEMTGQEVTHYGADDSICTKAVANLFEVIMKYEGTYDAFYACEPAPAYLCAESFLNGQKFDLKRLAELDAENLEKEKAVWEKINNILINLEWERYDQENDITTYHKFPGCFLDKANYWEPAEIKKVMKQIGVPFTCTAKNMLDKLVEIKAPLGLAEFNEWAEDQFVPKPELNIGSSKQVCALLYDTFSYPVRIRGKISAKMRREGRRSGNPSGNESSIRHAIMYDASESDKELLLLLIQAKGIRTDRSLFLVPYAKMPNKKDNLVHPNHGQSLTKSRRAASNGPNFSQVSKKSPIREVYVPPEEDLIWWSMDFSGQELRITAERSQCPVMLACYPDDGPATDVHSVVGIEVAKLDGLEYSYDDFINILDSDDHPDKKKLKDFRAAGKRQVFGSVYGQTEIGLAEKLLVPVERARQIVAANDAAFPGVTKWKADTEERLLKDKFGTTLLGARRHLNFDGTWKDKHEVRSGINCEIQGPAGEQTKQVQKKFWERRIFERYDAGYCFSVYDELNGFVSKSDCIEFLRDAHPIMLEQYADMKVPVESSIEIGTSFGTLINIGTKFDEEKLRKILEVLKNA